MIAHLCKKEIRKISLPDVIISEIITFCRWKIPKMHMWYIIASKLDSTRLDRAKHIDTMNTFLSNDDDDDMLELFKNRESLDYVNHIRMNKTI